MPFKGAPGSTPTKKSPAPAPPQLSQQPISQRQADEIEALTSILADDFVSAHQTSALAPWGTAAQSQPFFILTIRPDDEEFRDAVWVKVEIRLPKKYPAIPLIVSCPSSPKPATSQNVDAQQLAALGDALRNKAIQLAASGDEAIWEVYSCGSELLSASNMAKEAKQLELKKREDKRKADAVLSLDEEMKRREGEGQKVRSRSAALSHYP